MSNDCCTGAALPADRVAAACDRALDALERDVAARWPALRADRVAEAATPAFTLFGRAFGSRSITPAQAEAELRDSAENGDFGERVLGTLQVGFADGLDDATEAKRSKLKQLRSLSRAAAGLQMRISTSDFAAIAAWWS